MPVLIAKVRSGMDASAAWENASFYMCQEDVWCLMESECAYEGNASWPDLLRLIFRHFEVDRCTPSRYEAQVDAFVAAVTWVRDKITTATRTPIEFVSPAAYDDGLRRKLVIVCKNVDRVLEPWECSRASQCTCWTCQ